MAINMKDNTMEALQVLSHDAFNINAVLDRCKSILATKLACPITSSIIHHVAHIYPLIADSEGDLLEGYNEPVRYGNIPEHVENFSNPLDVLEKVQEELLIYQNELNVAYERIMNNKDFHILVELGNIMIENNKYIVKSIQWRDIAEKYGDDPNFDIAMKYYE